jgi:hypothetical protein
MDLRRVNPMANMTRNLFSKMDNIFSNSISSSTNASIILSNVSNNGITSQVVANNQVNDSNNRMGDNNGSTTNLRSTATKQILPLMENAAQILSKVREMTA